MFRTILKPYRITATSVPRNVKVPYLKDAKEVEVRYEKFLPKEGSFNNLLQTLKVSHQFELC